MSRNYIEKARWILSGKVQVEPELFDLYTLLVFTRGRECALEDVHDAWSIWRTNTMPEHRSIIPFELLSEEVQLMDKEYADAIKETATELLVGDLKNISDDYRGE